jgi:hypothetical protein
MKFTQKIGSILLAIYLILVGLSLVGVVFLAGEGARLILGGLAIAAGIFILIER